MKKYVFSEDTGKLLRVEEATPKCGDYCDSCGDCLHCFGEDTCPEHKDGKHYWVEYE